MQGQTHGMSKTPTYKSWKSMKDRCKNSTNAGYHLYGGRGITYAKEWEKFENFYQDMGERPTGKTLDRIDSDGDYTPKNCKWSDIYEQNNNKSNVLLFNGESGSQAERRLGLSRGTVKQRVRKGWSIKRAFSQKKYSYRLKS